MIDIWDITIGPYMNLLGPYFWAVMVSLVAIPIWIKTKSIGPTFIVIIVGLLMFITKVPGNVQMLFIFFIAFGIAYAAYRLLVRVRR